MDNLVNKFLDLIYPKRCLNCSNVGDHICDSCLGSLSFCETQICPECQRPAIGGFTHALCQHPQGAERLLCAFKFEGPIEKGIKALKYQGVKEIAQTLIDLALESFTTANVTFGEDSLIVPVPLHPIKKLERGFNQAVLLSSALAQRLGLEMQTSWLMKEKENPSQTRLNAQERAVNVRGVYSLNPKAQKLDSVRDRDVVLVDDVFTSGATLRECAKVLKRAGARFVYLLAIAKD